MVLTVHFTETMLRFSRQKIPMDNGTLTSVMSVIAMRQQLQRMVDVTRERS